MEKNLMYWLFYFTKAILVPSYYVLTNKQKTMTTDKVQVNILKNQILERHP